MRKDSTEVSPARGAQALLAEVLWSELRKKLVKTLLVRGIDEHSAEDLVQDGLALVWRKLPQLRNPERLNSWATSIVLNRLRTYLLRQKSTEEIPDELTGRSPEPLESMATHEGSELLRHWIESLRPELGSAVNLRVAEGLSPESASSALGISRERLRRRLYAGLCELRRLGSKHGLGMPESA